MLLLRASQSSVSRIAGRGLQPVWGLLHELFAAESRPALISAERPLRRKCGGRLWSLIVGG